MRNFKRKALPIGVVTEEPPVCNDNGQELVTIELNVRLPQSKAGHPFDNAMLNSLKQAALAESWTATELLCGLDVRGLLPEIYSSNTCSKPDKRTKSQRRIDATILVEKAHQEIKEQYLSLIHIDVSSTVAQIERRGRDAANVHFNRLDLRDLNRYMRTKKKIYTRDVDMSLDDLDCAKLDIQKIKALLTAVARCEEMLLSVMANKHVGPKRPPGRPRKTTTSTEPKKESLDPIIYKVILDDGDDAYLVAAHSGINPANLWPALGPAYDALEFVRLLGNTSRDSAPTAQDVEFFSNNVLPFLIGTRTPESECELKLCQLLLLELKACERSASRTASI